MKEIKLSKGFVAYVDDEDFERVNAHKWYASIESRGTKVYAKRKTKKHERERWQTVFIRMHHFVLDLPPRLLPEGFVVCHRNDDGLDCRRMHGSGKPQLYVATERHNMAEVPGWKKKGQKVAPEPFL